jgi:hypothetical protein
MLLAGIQANPELAPPIKTFRGDAFEKFSSWSSDTHSPLRGSSWDSNPSNGGAI